MSFRPWNTRPDGPTKGQKLTDVLDQKTGACHSGESLSHRGGVILGGQVIFKGPRKADRRELQQALETDIESRLRGTIDWKVD